MIVERQPIDDLILGLTLRGEFFAVQASHFQTRPETFCRRIVSAIALAAH